MGLAPGLRRHQEAGEDEIMHDLVIGEAPYLFRPEVPVNGQADLPLQEFPSQSAEGEDPLGVPKGGQFKAVEELVRCFVFPPCKAFEEASDIGQGGGGVEQGGNVSSSHVTINVNSPYDVLILAGQHEGGSHECYPWDRYPDRKHHNTW
jgi:hypothetical protein